jgi:hypothetical protein
MKEKGYAPWRLKDENILESKRSARQESKRATVLQELLHGGTRIEEWNHPERAMVCALDSITGSIHK